MKYTLLSLLLLLSFNSLYSQQILVAFKTEYGSYKMSDMHSLQNEEASAIVDSLRTKPKEVYGFPSYWGGQVRVGYARKRHNFFFNATQSSTGGRLYYEDYSGIIKVDKVVNNSSYGLGYGYSIIDKEKLKVISALSIGLAHSTLKTNNDVEIYVSKEKSASSNQYTSHQTFITPEIRLQYFPWKFLFIEASTSYVMQVHSTAQMSGAGSPLTGKNKNSVLLDWSGFRLGVGVGFKFNLVK